MAEAAPIRYASAAELIYINGLLIGDMAVLQGRHNVRETNLLLAAEQRPQASAFGADAYPTLADKAAALLHSIARNHPFKDGNKRTATVATLFFLAVNGWGVAWDAADALERIVDVAEGRTDWPSIAVWLPLHPIAPRLEADEAADVTLIHDLIHTHRWLLDELAGR